MTRTKAPTPFFAATIAASLLVCWAIDLLYFPNTTVFPDEQRILTSAVRFAKTGEFWVAEEFWVADEFWIVKNLAWEMPGATAFFAIPVKLFGSEHAVIVTRIAQSVLLALQALLVGFMAYRLFRNSRTALIATAITAFYPFFLYYQGLLLTETLFNTFLVASFAALYAWRARGTQIDRWLILACALFAGATWTKATLTFLPPLLLAAAALTGQDKIRRAALTLVAGALLYAGFLSPWWIRNHMMLGAFVPLTTSAGANLYLGNNPANVKAGIDLNSDVEPDVVARIQVLPNEIDRQRAYNAAAIHYIQSEPATFLHNVARKFLRFWSVAPNAEDFNKGLYRYVAMFSFGPILLLAIAAVWMLRRMFMVLLPVYLLIGYFTAVHMVTIASLRYRLPLEPFLILLAAAPLGALWSKVRPKTA